MRGRIRVEPVKDSRLATVKFEDADPDRAQRILAAVVDMYISMNLEDALASTSQSADWLRNQLEVLKKDLESSEMALHEYKEKKNILSLALDDQSNMLREEMKQLNDTLTSVRTKREEISARRGELAKVKADNPNKLPASELLQSTVLQAMRRAYEDAVRDRDGLLGSGKGKNHPDVLAAQGRIDATREALLSEVRNIQGALDADLNVIKRQEAGLAGLFEGARKEAFELNLLEIEYNRLHRSKDNNEKLYALVLERTKEADLSRMLRVNNIRLVDAATRPGGPVRPQVPLNIGTGVFVGILLGIVAAMGRAMLDRSVKVPDDVEREIGVSFLGLLPRSPTRSSSPRLRPRPQEARRRLHRRRARAHRPQLPDERHRRSGADDPDQPDLHGAGSPVQDAARHQRRPPPRARRRWPAASPSPWPRPISAWCSSTAICASRAFIASSAKAPRWASRQRCSRRASSTRSSPPTSPTSASSPPVRSRPTRPSSSTASASASSSSRSRASSIG